MPEAQKAASRRGQISIVGLAETIAFLIGFASLAAFLGPWWWLADLCSHFRAHYFIGSLGLGVFFGLKRLKLQTGLVSGLAVINLIVLQPHITSLNPTAGSGPDTQLRVLWWNVQSDNENKKQAFDWLTNATTDLIAIGEINNAWASSLSGLKEAYPYEHIEAREDNFGIALYSKVPLFNAKTIARTAESVPSIEAEIHIRGRPVTIIATHPLPPIGNGATKDRNAQLQWLAQHIKTSNKHTVVLGDLNTTPWNHAFTSFLKRSGLSNRPKEYFATWPSWLVQLGIPLDHCLISDQIKVRSRTIGPDLGSDHSPMIVELTW